MLEFKIMTKVLNIGRRKGQTVHYAQAKSLQRMTDEMVVERLGNVVCDALQMGMSVNLAELGNLRLNVPSRMMDTAEEVTVANALKAPKIIFTPTRKMRDAASAVKLGIDRP